LNTSSPSPTNQPKINPSAPKSTLREVTPHSFIFEKTAALPDFLCEKMIERFEAQQAEQYQGRAGSAQQANESLKKTTDLVVSGKPHWQDVDNNLFRSLALALQEFRAQFPYFANMQRFQDQGYNLQRYQAGEYYHWHVDADHMALAARQLVALWYLNDVEEGGETEFLYQQTSIRPKQGTLVLFPPFWTHEHRAKTVAKGVKYIATTWITFRQ
jgi:predicted 2-oxoglutarate/Fe(II)-dependent dioxygenase YbiX